MSLAGVAMRSVKRSVEALRLVAAMAMLLVAALEAAAQAPPHVLGFSPPAVRALDQEHAMDLQALDAFSGKRRTEGLRPPGAAGTLDAIRPARIAEFPEPARDR